ncbi:response regulator [Kibdelosporangium phytohabitans]|uniref:LuxR family transcriptional regulator n=1 Tax=Kibdelosporangium phytohabitans TaxID=860235 RepID=A0A0N9I190_9PSEU|nr:response regulator transcription factor [Kibdelosporangium phytohabitans]ALG09580.1 LuxR family transcriptional regulator [Kibdelosporangium phytohabitans]MBE1469092.1 DNA-binding NarL/FixJ family response regulator [Kibdelosporangium phytohabitans]
MTIRVLIVDDHLVVRAGLAALLAGEPDIEVAGECADADEAVRFAAAHRPDVVLMDLQLGAGPDGVDATTRLTGLPDPPKVLMLTTYDAEVDITRAVTAGATGYLLKAGPPDDLFRGIRAAARGETALAPQVAARLFGQMRAPAPALTARETEIVQLLAAGLSNRLIAGRLFISEATVKTHLVHIYDKLGVESRAGAVAVAAERRLIRIDNR